MQLNRELLKIFRKLGREILGENDITAEATALFIKTPGPFRREYEIYKVVGGDTPIEITDSLSPKQYKLLKDTMGQAYFNYFNHYHTQYSKKYYVIMYEFVSKFGLRRLDPVSIDSANRIV